MALILQTLSPDRRMGALANGQQVVKSFRYHLTDPRQFDIMQSGPGWQDRMQFDQLRRRDFITLLGGAAAAWPLAARAQQAGRTYRLGFLIPSSSQTRATLALFDELRLNGFIEGQNLTVNRDGFEAGNEHLAELAAAIVKAAPDVIVAGAELPLRALQAATRTIPLVGMSDDMVAEGLVSSLARPGGNISGISLLSPEPGSLVTVTSPPIMRASLSERARPSPVPPKR